MTSAASGTLRGMAEKEPGKDGPSLELPALGLRRRGRRPKEPDPARPAPPESATTPEPPLGPGPATRPESPPPAAGSPADAAPGEPRRARLESVGATTAAIVTGAVVGALVVGLTWASLRFCELVQGTSSCGTPGFFLLLAIMVAMVLLGQLSLRTFGVEDPGSTSLLGVGLIAVVALLFLLDVLFAWWMALVIPLVGVASFALAQWVTTSFPGREPGDTRHR